MGKDKTSEFSRRRRIFSADPKKPRAKIESNATYDPTEFRRRLSASVRRAQKKHEEMSMVSPDKETMIFNEGN
jgi:hypothetical protein